MYFGFYYYIKVLITALPNIVKYSFGDILFPYITDIAFCQSKDFLDEYLTFLKLRSKGQTSRHMTTCGQLRHYSIELNIKWTFSWKKNVSAMTLGHLKCSFRADQHFWIVNIQSDIPIFTKFSCYIGFRLYQQ